MDACLWNGDLLKINRETFLKRNYFLEEFWVRGKLERKVHRTPIDSLPPHMHSPPPPLPSSLPTSSPQGLICRSG